MTLSRGHSLAIGSMLGHWAAHWNHEHRNDIECQPLSALPGCAVETRSALREEGVPVLTGSMKAGLHLGVLFRALVVGMVTLPLTVVSLIYT